MKKLRTEEEPIMKTTYANIDTTIEDLDKAREYYGEGYDDYDLEDEEYYFNYPRRKRCGYFDY